MSVLFWHGDADNWSVPTNWSSNSTPASGDLAVVQSGIPTASGIGIVGQTVWLDYNDYNQSSGVGLNLINSSFDSTSYLLTNATNGLVNVRLHNSALHGKVFNAGGPTLVTVDSGSSAVNYGWWGTASDTLETANVTLLVNGSFGNNGTIEAGANGIFSLVFGQDPSAGKQYIGNTGIIQADPGSSIAFAATSIGTTSYSIFLNQGTINVDKATVAFSADLVQSDAGTIKVSDNGSLSLSGKSDGGTIQISSGSLYFPDAPKLLGIPYASTQFHSTLELTGPSATLTFGTSSIKQEFLAATRELIVSEVVNNQLISVADIHLGGPAAYSASDFSVQGATLTYTAHTSN